MRGFRLRRYLRGSTSVITSNGERTVSSIKIRSNERNRMLVRFRGVEGVFLYNRRGVAMSGDPDFNLVFADTFRFAVMVEPFKRVRRFFQTRQEANTFAENLSRRSVVVRVIDEYENDGEND